MSNAAYLESGGTMGELIRKKDWSKTAVGPLSSWPQSLKTALGLLTHSGFPSCLFWGPEFICFYNDAFKNSMGDQQKHPYLLGLSAGEGWPDVWPVLQQIFAAVMKGETFWKEDQPAPFFTKDHPTFGTFSFVPLYDDKDETAGVYITCYETTEKIHVLKKTAHDEAQLNFVLDAAEIGTWDLNPQTGLVSVNRWTREWYGLPGKEGIDFSKALHAVVPKDRDRVEASVREAIQRDTQGNHEIIYRIRNAPQARTRIVRSKGKAFFDDGPVAYRFQGTIEDITAEVNAHEMLRQSESKFRKLMDSSLVAMAILTGKRYLITSVNAAMLALWGKQEAEVMDRPFLGIVSEYSGQGAQELLETVCKTGERLLVSERKTTVFRRGKKVVAYLDLALEPIKDSDGNVTAIMMVNSDVTDRVNLQKSLADYENKHKRERLKASIEAQEKERELIANELHDNVNQLLASTKLYIGMIEVKDEKAATFAATSADYIDRCMTEIRNISHGLNPATLHFVGLSRSIRDMLEHINTASDIRFRFAERRNAKIAGGYSEVELAIFRITQIQVANILKHSHAKSAKVSLLYCHHFVELSIADDGQGFDLSKSRKGLGFLNILNRAELLQGTVTILSEPMQGCLLKVRIPWNGVRLQEPKEVALSVQ